MCAIAEFPPNGEPCSYAELRNLLALLLEDPGQRNWFRGQRIYDWPLEPSLAREEKFRTAVGDFDLQKSVLEDLLREFSDSLISHDILRYKDILDLLPTDPTKRSIELEGLAQHHTVPTLMLDWSVSPYISLFFAYSSVEDDQESHPVLWYLDKKKFKEGAIQRHRAQVHSGKTKDETWIDICNDSASVHFVKYNKSHNYRMRRQRGLFTRLDNPTERCLDKYVRKHEQYFPRATLTKVKLDKSERSLVMRDLDLMGINFGHLYYDRDAAAKDAIEKVLR